MCHAFFVVFRVPLILICILLETPGSKLITDLFTGFHEPSIVWIASKWTAGYDAELFVPATMVEASASNVYPWFTVISSTATAETVPTAAAEPIFSVAAKCEYALKSPAVIPAGSTAAFNGKSSVTTTIVTASASATATATVTPTTAVTTATTLAATTTYEPEPAAIAKDAGTIRSEVYEFNGITT